MMRHLCCCMLFSYIVWFEIIFQNDLNLHTKIWVEIRKRKGKGILLLSFYLACWPFPPAGPLSVASATSLADRGLLLLLFLLGPKPSLASLPRLLRAGPFSVSAPQGLAERRPRSCHMHVLFSPH